MFQRFRRKSATARSAISIKGLPTAKFAIIPKTMTGTIRPMAKEILADRFSGGPIDRRTALRRRDANKTSRIIGSKGGALTPAAMPPTRRVAGKKRVPSKASVRGPRGVMFGSAARKFAGILLAAKMKAATASELEIMIAGPAQ